jgi:hypothetical protein
MRFGLSEEQNLTQPTISFGHGFLDDCNDITGWTKTEAGLAASMTAEHGDYFEISGTCDNVANEYAYYTKDITDISTTIYPKLLVRWKTSEAANGLQARITAWYNDATFTDTVLGFSTIWKTSTIDLVAGKTLDKIRIYADDNPDTIAAGTFYVYFDFILVCQGIFTFPFVSGGVELEGFNNLQHLKIPGKVGNATQYLGGDDSTIRVYGDIDTTGVDASGVPVINSGWHGRWTTHDGETFYQILHYGFGDPWQWFTSDVATLKVTLDHMVLKQAKANENLLSYDLLMHEYRLGSGSAETHLERFGIT